MEQRIQGSVQDYMEQWKLDLQKKAVALNFTETEKLKELLEYMFHYPKWSISSLPPASHASGHKRKHASSAARVSATPDDSNVNTLKVVEVQGMYLYPTDIQGILYYLDQYDNVYLPDDVEKRSTTPRILGKLIRADHNEIDLELSMIQVKPEYDEFFRQWNSFANSK